MSTIDYDHSKNSHTVTGAHSALTQIFDTFKPRSLLDVGCGTGTWLKAAHDMGVDDLVGIDGIAVPPAQREIASCTIHQYDLTKVFSLGRKFEMVICLETAEHLPAAAAPALISGLTDHADNIVFSAAVPNQNGQHHINCQWPDYWQSLFNDAGFECYDDLRWRLWDVEAIEPWYRQNLFRAQRSVNAGGEARIHKVIHPEMHRHIFVQAPAEAVVVAEIEAPPVADPAPKPPQRIFRLPWSRS